MAKATTFGKWWWRTSPEPTIGATANVLNYRICWAVDGPVARHCTRSMRHMERTSLIRPSRLSTLPTFGSSSVKCENAGAFRTERGPRSAYNQLTRAHFASAAPKGRASLSGLYRPRPRRNSLPDRGLAAERLPRTARGDHLVLKRLSRRVGRPKVRAAAVAAVERHGAGAGGTRNISGTHHQLCRTRGGARRSSSKRSGSCLHLGLGF
jgi:hypothetical protein